MTVTIYFAEDTEDDVNLSAEIKLSKLKTKKVGRVYNKIIY
jgi:hypothetical protein